MKVLFAASELTPIAKVGGLGDVAGALPIALKKLGVDIRVALPYYESVHDAKIPVKKLDVGVIVRWNDKPENVEVYETVIPGSDVPLYLFEHPILSRGPIYMSTSAFVDSEGELNRFTFFSQVLSASLNVLPWQPKLLHLNDWHLSFVPLLLRAGQRLTPTLLTIHNLANQGITDPAILSSLGLTPTVSPELEADLRDDGRVNIFQEGLVHATFLNTVSPTYAEEIKTPEFGEGLDPILRRRSHELVGILNGIDVKRFNPATDPHIPAHYSAENFVGKAACKAELQKRCGLAVDPTKPLFGLVSRLTNQKGIELIAQVLSEIVSAGGQAVLLGAGEPELEQSLVAVENSYPGVVFVKIGFDAALAQEIYAGADVFLMPSRFEPCGLGQMVAMRYGTLPIVRATGGLKDSVIDVDADSEHGSGFVFGTYDIGAFRDAIKRSLSLFLQKDQWYTVLRRAMVQDFSWQHSSKEYLKLYERLRTD